MDVGEVWIKLARLISPCGEGRERSERGAVASPPSPPPRLASSTSLRMLADPPHKGEGEASPTIPFCSNFRLAAVVARAPLYASD